MKIGCGATPQLAEPLPHGYEKAIRAFRRCRGGIFARMQTLLPDERFVGVPNSVTSPVLQLDDHGVSACELAWVQDGPEDADPVLMLHGEPRGRICTGA